MVVGRSASKTVSKTPFWKLKIWSAYGCALEGGCQESKRKLRRARGNVRKIL